MPTTQGRKEGTRGAQFPGRQRWPESLFRLRSCSKVFKSGSGYGNFSNLKIWLLLRLWLPSIHPKFTIVFTYEMTMQTPVIVENEKWLRIRAQCFTNFWLRLRIRKKNAESCLSRRRNSGSMTTSTGPRMTAGRPKVPTISQVLSSIQYIYFKKSQVRPWSHQTYFLPQAPSNLVMRLQLLLDCPTTTVHSVLGGYATRIG